MLQQHVVETKLEPCSLMTPHAALDPSRCRVLCPGRDAHTINALSLCLRPTRSGGGCVSACRKHSRSPLAAAAPSFICTARPLPARMTLSASPLCCTSFNVLQQHMGQGFGVVSTKKPNTLLLLLLVVHALKRI